MTPKVLLATFAFVVILTALPLGQGHGEEVGRGAAPWKDANAGAWPCCDHCALCDRTIPPTCACLDSSPGGCHPGCKDCVPSTTGAGVRGAPLFQCLDSIVNFCERRCTPASHGP
ncbi:hypothetical protein HU200_004740 [Digitaria exilis]|uniref:Bowman-Birk serine protease inhibitors family domain-containing protein n=1 Tax=Digitaria exilis TaxID=1010633 RepID=A0A835FSU6_9POAL|nr:hypothetical protein HU200_004740 [Digitaria exilis]CAB3474805.1 unnamed protein product [Digitaria exilis]